MHDDEPHKIGVLGFGAVAVDDLVFLDHFPLPEEKMPILSSQRQGGGLIGTALVAAARLGVPAAYCGVFGLDDLCDYSKAAFREEGVDISLIQEQQDARPFHSLVLVDQTLQQRTILFNQQGVTEPQLTTQVREAIKQANVILIDHNVLGIAPEIIRLAHEFHIPVVADFERHTDSRLMDVLYQVDHLILSERTARNISGQSDLPAMATWLSRHNPDNCVITVGDRGCWWKTRDTTLRHMRAFTVPVVDTTGCGDVFHGVYCACLCLGFSLEICLHYATAASGMKAGVPGGRAGSPTRAAIEQFLQNHAGEVRSDE